MKKISFIIIVFSWLVSLPVVLIRLVYSITIIPITDYLHINYFLSSVILSSFFVGYVIFSLPMNHFVDKYGYRVIGISMLFLSLLIFLFTFVTNFTDAIILIVLIGVTATPTYTGAIKLISDRIEYYRATAIGILNTTGPIVLFLSSFILPSYLSQYRWQLIYVYISIFTLTVGIPFFFIKNTSFYSTKESINIKSIIASLVKFFGLWGMWGTSTYLFLLVHYYFHLSLIDSGVITGIFAIGGLISVFTIGFISDMFKKREEISKIFLILFFVMLAIYSFLPVSSLYLFSFILGFIAFGYKTPLDTYISEITKGKEATSMGLANLISQPSSIIVPIIIGYIIAFTENVTIAFISLSIGPLIAFLLIMKLK
ncbi:MAG: MFS transporter [Thermoplasmata archaeon]